MKNSQVSQTPPIFAAQLTPYRSLSKKGFFILMLIISLSSFLSGLVFLLHGVWPIFFFFGIDVALIFLAFKLNYRDGRVYEEIAIWRHDLTIRKVKANGDDDIYRFNPFFTRLNIERHEEYGITRMSLVEKSRKLVIGAFLNPQERDSFAKALGTALAKARA